VGSKMKRPRREVWEHMTKFAKVRGRGRGQIKLTEGGNEAGKKIRGARTASKPRKGIRKLQGEGGTWGAHGGGGPI